MAEPAAECAEPEPGPVPLTVYAVLILGPLWRHGRPGEAYDVDLEEYARQMTGYLAQNLEGFADPRGGDVFLRVVVKRDAEHGGHEYRSGHFLKERSDEGSGEDG